MPAELLNEVLKVLKFEYGLYLFTGSILIYILYMICVKYQLKMINKWRSASS
jgi:hypothetical protein